MAEMNILDKSGDIRLQFDKVNEAEVEAARERFNEYKSRGWMAYKVDSQGKQAEVIYDFDPSAERIILQPQMIGG